MIAAIIASLCRPSLSHHIRRLLLVIVDIISNPAGVVGVQGSADSLGPARRREHPSTATRPRIRGSRRQPLLILRLHRTYPFFDPTLRRDIIRLHRQQRFCATSFYLLGSSAAVFVFSFFLFPPPRRSPFHHVQPGLVDPRWQGAENNTAA